MHNLLQQPDPCPIKRGNFKKRRGRNARHPSKVCDFRWGISIWVSSLLGGDTQKGGIPFGFPLKQIQMGHPQNDAASGTSGTFTRNISGILRSTRCDTPSTWWWWKHPSRDPPRMVDHPDPDPPCQLPKGCPTWYLLVACKQEAAPNGGLLAG